MAENMNAKYLYGQQYQRYGHNQYDDQHQFYEQNQYNGQQQHQHYDRYQQYGPESCNISISGLPKESISTTRPINVQPAQANKVDPLAAHPQCLPFTSMQGPSHPDQHLINPPAALNNPMQPTNQDYMLYNANQATEVQFMKQIDNMTPQFVVHDRQNGDIVGTVQDGTASLPKQAVTPYSQLPQTINQTGRKRGRKPGAEKETKEPKAKKPRRNVIKKNMLQCVEMPAGDKPQSEIQIVTPEECKRKERKSESGARTQNDIQLDAKEEQKPPGKRNETKPTRKKKIYECPTCGRSFRSYTNHKNHMLAHEGKFQYKCKVCEKLFNNQVHYKAHMDRHFNVKRFKCEKCDHATVSKSDMKQHMRQHTGDKPFMCKYCDKWFTHNSNKNTHEKTHDKKHVKHKQQQVEHEGKQIVDHQQTLQSNDQLLPEMFANHEHQPEQLQMHQQQHLEQPKQTNLMYGEQHMHDGQQMYQEQTQMHQEQQLPQQQLRMIEEQQQIEQREHTSFLQLLFDEYLPEMYGKQEPQPEQLQMHQQCYLLLDEQHMHEGEKVFKHVPHAQMQQNRHQLQPAQMLHDLQPMQQVQHTAQRLHEIANIQTQQQTSHLQLMSQPYQHHHVDMPAWHEVHSNQQIPHNIDRTHQQIWQGQQDSVLGQQIDQTNQHQHHHVNNAIWRDVQNNQQQTTHGVHHIAQTHHHTA